MRISTFPPIEYHQQNNSVYCGPACAQMILHQIGAGHISQDVLYGEINRRGSRDPVGVIYWIADPEALTGVLIDKKPAAFSRTFVLFELTDAENISRKIVWTLHNYQVGPAALVYGSLHWVVVSGCEVSATPQTSDDITYSIEGFYIHNPSPELSPIPPQTEEPHFSTDSCGTPEARGLPNEFIAYDTWLRNYMLPVTAGYWTGKFLAVCDPAPPPAKKGNIEKTPHHYSGETILSPSLISELAEKTLKKYSFFNEKYLEKLNASKPVLVQHLDRKNDFFYIIPMNDSDQKTKTLICMDARYGNFQQAAFSGHSGKNIRFSGLSKKMILEILSKQIKYPDKIPFKIYPELIQVYPTLVWKPCKESLTPYLPFYMIVYGDDRIYVRMDGKIFTSLTTNEKGI